MEECQTLLLEKMLAELTLVEAGLETCSEETEMAAGVETAVETPVVAAEEEVAEEEVAAVDAEEIENFSYSLIFNRCLCCLNVIMLKSV